MLPKLPASVPQLGLISAPISGVSVGLQSSLPLQSSCLFEGIPLLLVSSNHLDSVLLPWPISNSFVVSRRMTWRESTSWPSPKKMTQVGGHFPPCVTLRHSRKGSFMCFVCIVEPCTPAGMGSPSLLGWGAGMLLGVYASGCASRNSNSGYKQMASWEKKVIPSTPAPGFAP